MSVIEKQVTRARQRLILNTLFEQASRAAIWAGSVWIGLLVARQILGLPIPPPYALGAALLSGLVIVAVGTWPRRVSRLRAAAELDEAARLKERLSTALAVARTADPFAVLTVRDAEQAAARVQVNAHLRYRVPRDWHWSAAMLAACVILGLFLPPVRLLARRNQPQTEQQAQAIAEKRAIEQDLAQRIEQIRQLAATSEQLKDLASDVGLVEIPERAIRTPEDVRQEAARQIDELSQRLESARQKVQPAALRETQRLLARLQPETGADSASRLSQELSRGDLDKAAQALQQIEQQARQAGQGQNALGADELRQKLDSLARQLGELGKDAYLQKELERKLGLSPEQAQQLAHQLAQMDPKEATKELERRLCERGLAQEQIQDVLKRCQQKLEARRSCCKLGQCLAQASENLAACSQGDKSAGERAAAALAEARRELSRLQDAERAAAILQAENNELRKMRELVCQGGYCSSGVGGREAGRGTGPYFVNPGTTVRTEATRVRLTPGKGQILGEILGDLPAAARASAETRTVILTAQRAAIDAINRQQVPREYQSVVRWYFDQLAGLLGSRTAQDAQAPDAAEPADGAKAP